jgi:hypothetical protein
MNRNGILGELDDRHLGDGATKDPDGNLYDPGGKFRWNDRRHWILIDFAAWQKATGPDLHSRVGSPSFVDAKAGDLHLAPGDRIARGAGVGITPIAPVDLDGDPRAPQGDAAGADVPPPAAARLATRARPTPRRRSRSGSPAA